MPGARVFGLTTSLTTTVRDVIDVLWSNPERLARNGEQDEQFWYMTCL